MLGAALRHRRTTRQNCGVSLIARALRHPRAQIKLASWKAIFAAVVAALLFGTTMPSALAQAKRGQTPQNLYEMVRAADLQLATIGYRLATANAGLCDRLEPATGLKLHTLDQFNASARDAAKAYFRFESPLAVEGVVAGSPAETAGVRAGDSIVRIASIDLSQGNWKAGTTQRLVAVEQALLALPIRDAIVVEILRKGAPLSFTLQPTPACQSRYELRIANDFEASADGSMVQISSRFLETFPADQVAAVVAHELSHNILHHRERLEARGVQYGIMSMMPGNAKYFRQTEIAADILSLTLLKNAGIDSGSAIAFWRVFGPRYSAKLLRSSTHPAWRDRVATMEREIAASATAGGAPLAPKILADRAAPLNGDWQSLMTRR